MKKNIFCLSLFCFFLNICFSKDKSQLHPIDSSYGWVDSVFIEYFIPANAIVYNYTFNRNSINVWSNFYGNKVITDQDTIIKMKNYVESLFISGREKTEVGRSYRARLEFTDYEQIRISLFVKGALLVKHEIYDGMENYAVEFSETFENFGKLLRAIYRSCSN